VKIAARSEGLDVLQPERASDPALLQAIKHIAPDVGVVVAYGHILKSDLLQTPRRGMVNVHPSLLPELRGAAPIEWAILNGDETTGVTIMQMDEELDAGPILHRLPHRIDPGTTGGELSDHLAEIGAQALVEALALWERDGVRPVPQHHALATYAPKLTREIARIDWAKPADVIVRQTLALDPRPGAWTELDGLEVKLFGGSVAAGSGATGDVLPADDRLLIAAGSDAVEVAEVQPAGKARMPAAEWIRGRGVTAGRRFV
jgi:methionyl-tRNA formyltransferase